MKKKRRRRVDILDEFTPEQLAALRKSIKEDNAGKSIDYDTSKKAFDIWRNYLHRS